MICWHHDIVYMTSSLRGVLVVNERRGKRCTESLSFHWSASIGKEYMHFPSPECSTVKVGIKMGLSSRYCWGTDKLAAVCLFAAASGWDSTAYTCKSCFHVHRIFARIVLCPSTLLFIPFKRSWTVVAYWSVNARTSATKSYLKEAAEPRSAIFGSLI